MPLQFLAAQQYDFFAGFEDQHTEEMFESAYPEIKSWINLKKKYDPNLIFQSQFFVYLNTILNNKTENAK
jgi:hypothetical protein